MISRVLCTLAATSLCSLAYGHGAERGTAEGAIRGKKVRVEYGRAELKGRSLDSLIAALPDDRVWRAGTDEVTTLTTEGDLVLDCLSGSACTRARAPAGGRKVRAGKYTVYISAPPNGAYSLILNSDPGLELGELGRILGFSVPESDARRLWPHVEGYNLNRANGAAGIAQTEVARAPMRPGTADPPVDPFTIRLEPSSSSGLTLTFAWVDKTWSVDLHGTE